MSHRWAGRWPVAAADKAAVGQSMGSQPAWEELCHEAFLACSCVAPEKGLVVGCGRLEQLTDR